MQFEEFYGPVGDIAQINKPIRYSLSEPGRSNSAIHILPLPEPTASSFATRDVSAISVYATPEILVDYRFICKSNGVAIHLPDFGPNHDKYLARLIANNRPDHVPVRRYDGVAFVVFTPRLAQYGHFLTEIFPRLLIVRSLYDSGLRYPIIWPATAPKFVEEFVNLILPGCRRIIFDEYAESMIVQTALMPSLCNENYFYHPALRKIIAEFTANVKAAGANSQPSRLFLGRKGFRETERKSDIRVLTNETALAQIAETHGFSVVEPQNWSVSQQILAFASASIVVGEASSALHNTIFSPPGTRILSLNFINYLQTSIAGLCGHSIDYLLATDGRVRNWDTPELRHYAIDENAFSSALSALCGD